MALESGGRADKEGNTYEDHFLGQQLLLLAEGNINCVEVEPLGEEGVGIEFTCTQNDGSKYYYQCKASNNTQSHWTVSSLANHKVFENAKKHILRDPTNEFHFISPLPYSGIDDLCNRARTNHSAKDFISYQLSNDQLRNLWANCQEHFNLSESDPNELHQLMHILSHCYFECIPFSHSVLQNLDARFNWLFSGNGHSARLLLEKYVHDEKKYGILISNYDVISFMNKLGYPLKSYGKDETVLHRIQTLNDTHWGTYNPINDELVPRSASDIAVNHLTSNFSVILHGKAGSGKSGCVEIISTKLKALNIPYLRLKLDKVIPKTSSFDYGQELGLPDSPVKCLQQISAGKECVLILDQLDTLRWTSNHSATAFEVCKELIEEVNIANEAYGAHISILFVVRSFDYKTESRIQKLFFGTKDSDNKWKEVEVGMFSKSEVKRIVGADYGKISQKLKMLLQNPASLYIWTKLQPSYKNQPITSANQLFYKWWEQILNHHSSHGISSTELTNAVLDISQKMNTTSLFTLLRTMVATHSQSIIALESDGMLTCTDSHVSFAHQTFLDYFIANDWLLKILSGTSLMDLVGDPDNQTPNLRYRFLVLLQQLCECHESLFLEQCRIFLQSESVRHYYKCIVFDVLAQQSDPSEALCTFAMNYWSDSDWHEYVQHTIYTGNPQFVKHLNQNKNIDWLSENCSHLLRSISEKDPDFVASVLKPLSLKTEEIDTKILRCLCFDVENDSDEMYKLRLDILKTHPSLLSSAWNGFYHLFEGTSLRAIDYITLIVDRCADRSIQNIHFPSEATLLNYSKSNYFDIISNVIPRICSATANMAFEIKEKRFDENFTRWNKDPYNERGLRKIIQMVKEAILEMAMLNPTELLHHLLKEDLSNSLIGNELILFGIEALPITFANEVIEWLSSKFPAHIFNYTEHPSDYLSTTKKILGKFTPHCEVAVFECLEQKILHWKDPLDEMLYKIKHRSLVRKNNNSIVYYAYWGFMQKELLPTMDSTRLSNQSLALINVLNRNDWIYGPHYNYGISMSSAGFVSSPISQKAHEITDKTWLQIISTPPEKMNEHSWKEVHGSFIEANHFQFAGDFTSQAEKHPDRFAELSLQFPQDCPPGYVCGVLQALQIKNEEAELVNIDLTSRIIQKFSQTQNDHVLARIADVVKSRSKEAWSDDIFDIIQGIALLPVTTAHTQYVTGSEDKSAHDIYNAVYNTPQGCAIRAITSLLFSQPSLLSTFKSTITFLSETTETFILLALTDCSAACYNQDKDFSTTLFKSLVAKDIRTLISHSAWDIISRDYNNDPDFYRSHLIKGVQSNLSDLSEDSARLLCASAIYKQDLVAQEILLKWTFSQDQATRICFQAAKCFEYEEYRDISKQVILRMATVHKPSLHMLDSDFFKDYICIEQDANFLISLIKTHPTPELIHSLIRFLKDIDGDITPFADIISAISSPAATLHKKNPWDIDIDDLTQCVAHLYDTGRTNPEIKHICLDIWDILFKNNLNNRQSLSVILDSLT